MFLVGDRLPLKPIRRVIPVMLNLFTKEIEEERFWGEKRDKNETRKEERKCVMLIEREIERELEKIRNNKRERKRGKIPFLNE